MKMLLLFVVLSVQLLTSTRSSPGQSTVLTEQVKQQTIDRLAALLPERYAYKEVGPKLQQLLQENLKSGKYASIISPEQFSVAVTKDLRSLNSDRHLALNYSPERPPPTGNNPTSTPLTPEERAREASKFNRQMNFGFKEVRFLNGGIGYVKFDYFDAFLDYSKSVVDASMLFLKNSDAIIIDLRENGGGASQMVGYIEGFFFDKRTLAGRSYDRLTDTTTETFIVPQADDKQLQAIDIFILTSKRTVSAAEGLAYDLKYLRKAVIVGEQSAGAANPGRVTRLNSLYTAFIPNRHGMNIISGTNWEGTGVPVDIACSAEDSLRRAQLEALTRLRQRATTQVQRNRFTQYITYLETAGSRKDLPTKNLLPYVGEYEGGRTVTLKEGRLYYSRVAEAGGELHFISPDVFMLAEGDTRIEFKRDNKGRVVALDSRWSLSDNSAVAQKMK